MSLPLSHYRTFAKEEASPDMNSAKGDRSITSWINKAIQRVWADHPWHHTRATGRFTMVPEETGSYLSFTQGSRVITLNSAQSETFAEKYLTEGWVLFPQGEGRLFFELDRIDDPLTARMKPGHEWPRASASDQTYTWVRSRYELPEDFWRLERSEDLDSFGSLRYLEPAEFDRDRASAPTQRGNRPWTYTVRGGKIEVWPGSGSNYVPIEWTYRRAPPRYTTATPAETEVDWPDTYSSLLEDAILVEASKFQGENAPVPYAVALNEYTIRLKQIRKEDAQVSPKGGRMGLSLAQRRRPFVQSYGVTDS